MNEQEAFWQGSFGTEYTRRNRVDIPARVPFWNHIASITQPVDVVEVGCNAGWNLAALKIVSPDVYTIGIDVNPDALDEAFENGYVDEPVEAPALQALNSLPTLSDLVFTAGVLIHVPTSDLRGVITAMREASSHYVLAVEYEDEQEVEVEYRGHANKLWRRPYGKILEECGLRIIESGKAEGFDDCTYWLCERKDVAGYAPDWTAP